MQKAQITEIKIKNTVEGENGSLEVRIHARTGEPAFLCAQLLTADGREADRIFPVAVEAQMDFCMQAQPVQLWDAERVRLYDLVLELRDEKMQLLGSTVKKIAFRRWDAPDILNGKKIERRVKLAGKWERFGVKEIRNQLSQLKNAHYNTLRINRADASEAWRELCLEYGIYLEETGPLSPEENAHAGQEWLCGATTDFALNVTQQGVLIENHCVFANASEYELHYALLHEGKTVYQGNMEADVPPGSGRYVEIAYPAPLEAGEYCYRAALRLKRDTAWAKKGTELAAGETAVSNIYVQPGRERIQ